jgi:thiamine phosphate synthase YjbQ (UPF0047 family)
MEAFARISTFRQATIHLQSHQRTDVIDLTDEVESLVAGTAVERGTLNIRSFHGATAVLVGQPDPVVRAVRQVGAPVCMDVSAGRLRRNPGERIYFVDLDGPRNHDLSVLLVGGEE